VRRLLPLLIVPLLGCPTEPDPGPSAADGSFHALTYNVHGFSETLAGDDPAARMPQILDLLPDFDVVGLQELWDDRWYDVLAEAEHPTKERFDTPLNEDRVYGSGLAQFAHVPHLDYREVHYETCNGLLDGASDCLASKGFQAMRLELAEGAELDWYNTHFEAGGGDADDAARAAQIELMLEVMGTWSLDRPLLLIGDLNLHSDDPVDIPQLTRLVDGAGLVDSCESIDCADPTHIDRLLTRDGMGLTLQATEWEDDPRFYDAAGEPLSDHPAIRARFDWSFEPE